MANKLDAYKKISNNALNSKAQQYLSMLQAKKYTENSLANKGLSNSGIGANQQMGIYRNYANNVASIDNEKNNLLAQQRTEEQNNLYNSYYSQLGNSDYDAGQKILEQAKNSGLDENKLSSLSNYYDVNYKVPYEYSKNANELTKQLDSTTSIADKKGLLEAYKGKIQQDLYDTYSDTIEEEQASTESLYQKYGVDETTKKYVPKGTEIAQNAEKQDGLINNLYNKASKFSENLKNGIITLKNGTNKNLKNGDIVDLDRGAGKANYIYIDGQLYKVSNKTKANYKLKNNGKNFKKS